MLSYKNKILIEEKQQTAEQEKESLENAEQQENKQQENIEKKDKKEQENIAEKQNLFVFLSYGKVNFCPI